MTTGIVVLSDVRGSRRLSDRADFVRRLEATLEDVNRDAGGLVGAFEAQAGLDEFAGVVRPGEAGDILLRLWESLHPVEIRYAVVQGALDVVPEPEQSGCPPGAAGFDGPPFHRAIQLLDRLRDSHRLVEIRSGGNEREDRLLTALGDLLYGRILGWTERQMEVLRAYRRSGSQRLAAEELGVSQSTVSRALSAMEHRRIDAARRAFTSTLDAISTEADG